MTLPPTPTIAVVGSGAVGLYYGGRLAQLGLPVHFLLRSDFQSLSSHGLHVRSCHGDFSLPPYAFHAHRSPSTMPPADLLLIALKTTSNHLLPTLLPPLIKPTTILLTLQNGLGNEDLLASLYPSNPILGGIAFTCINRTYNNTPSPHATPTLTVNHTSHGLIRLGSFSPLATDNSQLATATSSLFQRAKIHCEPIPNLLLGRWRKLIWNVPFNGLGAALDLATDQLLSSPTGTHLVSSLMHEIMSASAAVGLPFPDPDSIVQHQLAETRQMARYHTSMQLDRRHRRPLEHDAIVHEPLLRGTAAHVPMPCTSHLYDLLSTLNATLAS